MLFSVKKKINLKPGGRVRHTLFRGIKWKKGLQEVKLNLSVLSTFNLKANVISYYKQDEEFYRLLVIQHAVFYYSPFNIKYSFPRHLYIFFHV